MSNHIACSRCGGEHFTKEPRQIRCIDRVVKLSVFLACVAYLVLLAAGVLHG